MKASLIKLIYSCIGFIYSIIPLLGQDVNFVDNSFALGGEYIHQFAQEVDPMPLRVSGGIAVADINNDSYQDVFFLLGDHSLGQLLLNQGDGNFIDITVGSGLESLRFRGSGPLFFNYNQDEYIDLIIGSVDGHPPIILKNNGDLSFTLITLPEFSIMEGRNTTTITAIDFDQDGLDDLFFSHWLEDFRSDHFWRNMGNGSFVSMDEQLGFYAPFDETDFMHAANFIDLNHDTYPDLLLCSDFGTSQIWYNDQGNRFYLDELNQLSDENGMGSAIGDFDNDEDFDWFVSSIYDDDGVLEGNWGGSGNKFYVNQGGGILSERAMDFGVENSDWAWGASFTDLNNDGFLDLAVVNGWPQGSDQFKNDHLRIFLSQRAEYFMEVSLATGLLDTLQGRGLSCFDFDKDGDIDILVSNYRGPVKLWENKLGQENSYVSLRLSASKQNYFGYGSLVKIYTGTQVQSRVLSCGSNYVSQNPAVLHFGLGQAPKIDSVLIRWPDETQQRLYNLDVNQEILIQKPVLSQHTDDISAFAFPNPASSNLDLIFTRELSTDLRCVIRDASGKLILESDQYSAYDGQVFFSNINITNLPSGVYFASLEKGAILKSIRFIKN